MKSAKIKIVNKSPKNGYNYIRKSGLRDKNQNRHQPEYDSTDGYRRATVKLTLHNK